MSKTPNECPVHDIKLSNGEAPFLELWGMRFTPTLPLLFGPLMEQRELFKHLTVWKQITDIKLN